MVFDQDFEEVNTEVVNKHEQKCKNAEKNKISLEQPLKSNKKNDL